MLKGKIHRATVVQAELDYVGSITVDEDLMDAAGIREYEQVQIVDVNNGQRFETYVIAGQRGSGMICLNGAAARCVSGGRQGDHHVLRPDDPRGSRCEPAARGVRRRRQPPRAHHALRAPRPTGGHGPLARRAETNRGRDAQSSCASRPLALLKRC